MDAASTAVAGTPPPLRPAGLLDLPDELLASIVDHLGNGDIATEATARAIRVTCTRLRVVVRGSVGPALTLNPVGRLSRGVAERDPDQHYRLKLPFHDLNARIAALEDRVAASVALLVPGPSAVRELTIVRPPESCYILDVIEYDPVAFSGRKLLDPLLTAAGTLRLRSLTVGPLGAEAVPRAVAPGCVARDTLRRLHLCRLIPSVTTKTAVGAVLATLAPRLVDLSVEWDYQREIHNHPPGGVLASWLAESPRADALETFAFLGTLSVEDATALAGWAPRLTTLKLTLADVDRATSAALQLPALPHVRTLVQFGQFPYPEVLLAGRPLTSVTVVAEGLWSLQTNVDPVIEWLRSGSSAHVTKLATDLPCPPMANNLFGQGGNKHVCDALRTVVVWVFRSSGVIPILAKLPRLTALGINHRMSSGMEDDWVAVAKSFKALRSLSVLTETPDKFRPLLAAAAHLPSSVESLQLMAVKWPQRGRPCDSAHPGPFLRRVSAKEPSSADASAVCNGGADGGSGGGHAEGGSGGSSSSGGDGNGGGGGSGGGSDDGGGGSRSSGGGCANDGGDGAGVTDGPAAPASLRHLYFGYWLVDRSVLDRPSVPASNFFGWLPPRVVLAGELAAPPVGYVPPPGGSAIVPGSQDVCGWALA